MINKILLVRPVMESSTIEPLGIQGHRSELQVIKTVLSANKTITKEVLLMDFYIIVS
ncbi:MAG: hypothetical protein ABSH12_09385 [Endomicrobiales bacterium]|jgi:hypothetical protein